MKSRFASHLSALIICIVWFDFALRDLGSRKPNRRRLCEIHSKLVDDENSRWWFHEFPSYKFMDLPQTQFEIMCQVWQIYFTLKTDASKILAVFHDKKTTKSITKIDSLAGLFEARILLSHYSVPNPSVQIWQCSWDMTSMASFDYLIDMNFLPCSLSFWLESVPSSEAQLPVHLSCLQMLCTDVWHLIEKSQVVMVLILFELMHFGSTLRRWTASICLSCRTVRSCQVAGWAYFRIHWNGLVIGVRFMYNNKSKHESVW